MTNKPTYEELERRNKALAQEVDRLKQEEKGRRNEKVLSYAIDSLPHPFLLIDAEDYSIVMANAVAKQDSSAENKTCYALSHKCDAPCEEPMHICPLKEIKKTGRPAIVEHIHYDKQGAPRTVIVQAFPVFDENKRLVQIIEYSIDITESKHTEERLLKIERLMNATQELTKIGGWEWDLNNQTMFWTEELYRIYGFQSGATTPETAEFVSQSFQCYDLEDQRVVLEAFRLCLEKGQAYDLEFPFTTINGRRRWVRTITEAVMEGDRVVKVIGSLMDITDRKQAEEELKRSEDNLNRLFSFSDYMVCIADLEKGYFTKVSPAFTRHLGWSEEEMFSKPFLDFVHPDDVERTDNIIKEQMKRGVEVIQFENRYKTKEGNYRWFEWAANPVPAEGITYSAAYDITDRKLAEEALHESLKKLQEAQYIARIGDFTWDIASGEACWSDGMYKLLKYDKNEIIDYEKVNMDIHHPDDLARVTKWLEDSIASGEEKLTPNEYRLVCKDGEVLYVHTEGRIEYQEGKGVRLIGTCQDITERKRAEVAQEKLQEQLRQAQKMESIGTLAGGIAHDFNNILGIIVGNTELSMNDIPEENPAGYNLKEILKASLRAKEIVKQFLSFSRQTKQEAKPVRINSVIEESLKLIRSSIPTTVEIRQNLSTPVDTIHADPTQINQVLMNLSTNASHAMRENGGVLRVGLKNIDLDEKDATRYHDLIPGKYVVLTVEDTGHGIGPDVIERIFDPYFTTKEIGDGSGMGLSVVHGIVKNHNGAIHVYSEPGKGATFNVFFPVIKSETAAESTAHERFPTGTERILFVEDEPALADLGKRMLERLGYDVTMRTSSIEALEAFNAQPDKFDLLLTDMTMPDMTGKELAQALLRIRPGCPIILCSGFSEMIMEDNAQHLGIKAFIMKPLVMGELAETLRRVLDRVEEKEESINARILLVEDDDQMRGMIRKMLEGAGHVVVEAPDGKVAAKLYREQASDLIITDLLMPEKEGIELIQDLKHDFPDVKIIAISGGGKLDPASYLPLAKGLGAMYTFEKPFKKEDLLAAAQDILHL